MYTPMISEVVSGSGRLWSGGTTEEGSWTRRDGLSNGGIYNSDTVSRIGSC